MKRRLAAATVLAFSAAALAQSGGGGSPKFDQPAVDSPARPADGRYDLRPKFEKGQTIRLKLEVNNSAEQPAIEVDVLDEPDAKPRPTPRTGKPTGGREVEKIKSRIEFGIVMKVQDVDPAGNTTVDMTFQTVKVSIDGAGMKEEFDSTRPSRPAGPGEVDIVGTVLKPLVGTTITMTVDRAGNISRVTGGEGFAMLGQVTAGAGGSLPQVIGPILTTKKGDGFARVGESWNNVDKLDSGLMGQFTMTTSHTLSGVSGKDARVHVRGKIEPGSQAPGASTFQLKDSSYRGVYTWDLARGMIKQMSTTMSMKVEHRLQDTPVEVSSETTTIVTRLD